MNKSHLLGLLIEDIEKNEHHYQMQIDTATESRLVLLEELKDLGGERVTYVSCQVCK
jgi:hypothetical protein